METVPWENKPRFIIYQCTKCSNRVVVELDYNNLTYFKQETLICKNDLMVMHKDIIRQNDIIKEKGM